MTDKPGRTSVVQMSIKVEQGTKSISQAPYRIPDRLKAGVQTEVNTLLADGIIEESDSSCRCSPCVTLIADGIIEESDSSCRCSPCVTLIARFGCALTINVSTRLLHSSNTLYKPLREGCVLSKMDLSKGFYQVALKKD